MRYSITPTKYRINQDIKIPKVRLIDANGEQVGIVPTAQAIKMAAEQELDLVEIAPQADPPVCKIIDYGKFVYEQQKREKQQKKNQQVSVVKEIRLHPNTDTHDFDFKARHAVNFIEEGNKVKVAVIFKGRELAYTDLGRKLLERFIERLDEVAKVEQDIRFEGRTMHTILAPQKSKKKKK